MARVETTCPCVLKGECEGCEKTHYIKPDRVKRLKNAIGVYCPPCQKKQCRYARIVLQCDRCGRECPPRKPSHANRKRKETLCQDCKYGAEYAESLQKPNTSCRECGDPIRAWDSQLKEQESRGGMICKACQVKQKEPNTTCPFCDKRHHMPQNQIDRLIIADGNVCHECASDRDRMDILREKPIWEPTLAECRYYAGMFDADGCVLIEEKTSERQIDGRVRLVAKFTNKSRVLMDWLGEKLGPVFKTYDIPHITTRGDDTWYDFRMYEWDAYVFLRKIMPYMYIKRERAEFGMAYQALPWTQRYAGQLGNVYKAKMHKMNASKYWESIEPIAEKNPLCEWPPRPDFAAYCAGFLDGDGHVAYNKKNGALINVSFANTNVNPLLLMQYMFGRGKFSTSSYINSDGSIGYGHDLYLSIKDSLVLLEHLVPYMHIKKQHSIVAINAYKAKRGL